MLPELYLNCLESQLSASQRLTLEMLVWLLQFHKQVRIERLAACLPLPILYESRRRHVQRFLSLPQLSIPLLWFPLIKSILLTQIQPGTQVILALDRTQWKMKLFLTGVNFTKKKGFGEFSLAAYWKRKYRGKGANEGWYILTNLKSLEAALKVYQARSGIEAMFKDCKSGDYNLEDSKASVERLTSLVLLIALAYTCAGLRGQAIKSKGQQKYIGRLKELKRMTRRHSNFWVGLYGQMWIAALESESNWLRDLMIIRPNKLTFFQKGLRAMALIQADF